MKKPDNSPLKTPEDMLALAEALAARSVPAPVRRRQEQAGKKRLLRLDWRHGVCALGGAGLAGLVWWLVG